MEMSQTGSWWSQATKEVKAAKWLSVILMGGVVILFAPFIIMLLKAAVGMVAVIAALIAGLALFNVSPLLSKWLTVKGANFFLRLLKDEAVKNPIETMQNNLRLRKTALENAESELSRLKGQINTFRSDLRENREQFPGKDFGELERVAHLMAEAYNALEKDYLAAVDALKKYAEELRFAESKWRMALTSKSILKSLRPGGNDAVINRILDETAIRSVEETFNQSFAQLELSLASANTSAKQIPYQNVSPVNLGPVIEVEAEPVVVGVKR